jgi:SAM-dependent methyltransferase
VNGSSLPPVLDACCGSRMMWFDRSNPVAVFGDCRRETLTVTDRSHGKQDGTRTVSINPDVDLDFRDMPFPDESFQLVVFDPPHLVRAGKKSWLAAKYGKLSEDWREDLRKGFSECFRVLRPQGILIFKWNETQIRTGVVLALAEALPLFGHPTRQNGMTHWYTFMKNAEAYRRETEKEAP